tara:strand:+ start:4749 stop:4871 length:123 start_codon:yes stop_codon:yes gene_type:complete
MNFLFLRATAYLNPILNDKFIAKNLTKIGGTAEHYKEERV